MSVIPNATNLNIIQQKIRQQQIKIELLNFNFQTVDSIEGFVIDGSINIDANQDIRRSCTITITEKNSTFFIGANGKIWLDKYIKIYIGTKNNATNETVWCNMGIYLINNPNRVYNSTTNQLTFEGLDLMAKLTGKRNGQLAGIQTLIPQGSSIANAVKSILTELGGFKDFIIEDLGYTVPYDIKIDAGGYVYDLLAELRNLYSDWEMYFDVDGVFHFSQIPNGVNNALVLDFDSLNQNLIISDSINVNFENVKNRIIVYGRMLEDGHQVTGLAADYYENSPFNINTLGEITYIVEDERIYSDELARQRAKYELYLHSRLNDSIILETVPIYWLNDVNVKIKYSNTEGHISGEYLIKQLSIPLGIGSSMTINAMKVYDESQSPNPPLPVVYVYGKDIIETQYTPFSLYVDIAGEGVVSDITKEDLVFNTKESSNLWKYSNAKVNNSTHTYYLDQETWDKIKDKDVHIRYDLFFNEFANASESNSAGVIVCYAKKDNSKGYIYLEVPTADYEGKKNTKITKWWDLEFNNASDNVNGAYIKYIAYEGTSPQTGTCIIDKVMICYEDNIPFEQYYNNIGKGVSPTIVKNSETSYRLDFLGHSYGDGFSFYIKSGVATNLFGAVNENSNTFACAFQKPIIEPYFLNEHIAYEDNEENRSMTFVPINLGDNFDPCGVTPEHPWFIEIDLFLGDTISVRNSYIFGKSSITEDNVYLKGTMVQEDKGSLTSNLQFFILKNDDSIGMFTIPYNYNGKTLNYNGKNRLRIELSSNKTFTVTFKSLENTGISGEKAYEYKETHPTTGFSSRVGGYFIVSGGITGSPFGNLGYTYPIYRVKAGGLDATGVYRIGEYDFYNDIGKSTVTDIYNPVDGIKGELMHGGEILYTTTNAQIILPTENYSLYLPGEEDEKNVFTVYACYYNLNGALYPITEDDLIYDTNMIEFVSIKGMKDEYDNDFTSMGYEIKFKAIQPGSSEFYIKGDSYGVRPQSNICNMICDDLILNDDYYWNTYIGWEDTNRLQLLYPRLIELPFTPTNQYLGISLYDAAEKGLSVPNLQVSNIVYNHSFLNITEFIGGGLVSYFKQNYSLKMNRRDGVLNPPFVSFQIKPGIITDGKRRSAPSACVCYCDYMG